MKNNVASFYHQVSKTAFNEHLSTLTDSIEEKVQREASSGKYICCYRMWDKVFAKDLKKYFKQLGFKCGLEHRTYYGEDIYYFILKW